MQVIYNCNGKQHLSTSQFRTYNDAVRGPYGVQLVRLDGRFQVSERGEMQLWTLQGTIHSIGKWASSRPKYITAVEARLKRLGYSLKNGYAGHAFFWKIKSDVLSTWEISWRARWRQHLWFCNRGICCSVSRLTMWFTMYTLHIVILSFFSFLSRDIRAQQLRKALGGAFGVSEKHVPWEVLSEVSVNTAFFFGGI